MRLAWDDDDAQVRRALSAQSKAPSGASRVVASHAEPRHVASVHAAPPRGGARAVPHGGQALGALPGSLVERARPAAALLARGGPAADGGHAAPGIRTRDAHRGRVHERPRLPRALQAVRPGQVRGHTAAAAASYRDIC